MTDLKRALEIMAETFKDFSEISRKQYLNINDHYFLGKEDAYDLAIRYVENLIEIHFAKENGERVMKELIDHCMYESGLTADGCWDELDDYAKEAIERFARLLVQECLIEKQEREISLQKLADQAQEFGIE